MINLDISGDPNDSMTEKRREIFEPLGMQIANQMESTNARKRILRAPTMSLSAKDPSTSRIHLAEPMFLISPV